MSLDNIHLPTFLIGELYKNSLVEADNQQLKTIFIKTEEFVFLGKNQKNILLLVKEENATYLPDSDLDFLIGILSACKLSLSDIVLVNVNNNKEIKYKNLLEKFKPGIILFFGVTPLELEFPLQFPHFQLQKYNNQTYLSAPGLNELADDKQLKTQLWGSLKKLFSI
jgi:hypothetical protein